MDEARSTPLSAGGRSSCISQGSLQKKISARYTDVQGITRLADSGHCSVSVEEGRRAAGALEIQRMRSKAWSPLLCPLRVRIRRLKGLHWEPGDNVHAEGEDWSSLEERESSHPSLLASLLFHPGSKPIGCHTQQLPADPLQTLSAAPEPAYPV
ncbi:hypothetical protein H920_11292 [Fukomys damarensis]|uniref:Uncharacterized protein n=1 Tax=Fukomys damarensis TaxID=885580 RepID=A0A091D8A8_FUKDA|nr:hypothetical protein H920_11292 [Fukomys damarensis]